MVLILHARAEKSESSGVVGSVDFITSVLALFHFLSLVSTNQTKTDIKKHDQPTHERKWERARAALIPEPAAVPQGNSRLLTS